MPSAMGERQMLPRQTKRTETGWEVSVVWAAWERVAAAIFRELIEL